MKHTLLYMLAAVLLLGVQSCKDDEPEPMVSITILKSDVLFKAAGGTGTVEFASEATPTVTSDKDWCHATVSGNTLNVTVDPNVEYDARMATVTLSTGLVKKDIYVQQDGIVIIFPFKNQSYSVEQGGQKFVFSGTTTDESTITSDVDWITVSPSEDGFTVNVAKNKKMQGRIGHVTVSAPAHDNVAVMTFQQEAATMPPVEGEYTMSLYTSSSESKLYEYDVKLVPGKEYGEYYVTGLNVLSSGLAADAKMLMRQNTATQQFVVANGTELGTYSKDGTDYYGYVLVSYGNDEKGSYFNYTIDPKYDIYFDYTIDEDSKYHLTLHNSYPELISSTYESYGMYFYYFSAPEPIKANKVGSIKTVRRPRFDQK